jgi:hypothetical protein
MSERNHERFSIEAAPPQGQVNSGFLGSGIEFARDRLGRCDQIFDEPLIDLKAAFVFAAIT